MKIKIILLLVLLFFIIKVAATPIELNPEVFELLNLDLPELRNVKNFYIKGEKREAAIALLHYFRTRTGVVNPELDLTNIKLSNADKKMADEALEHKFFSHKGYQPSYFYGKDIDWDYWPVKDNELRWQLHRHKWFTPMGKAYRITGDEKYASAWIDQYLDWIKKNPLLKRQRNRIPTAEDENPTGATVGDNMRFSWRPLEVSHRLQDQCAQFQLFQTSEHFTPEFFTQFVVNYHKHATHIMGNFSKQGNHLLFEAQRILLAGSFFPEFNDAESWRKRGIEILNGEMSKQIFADGFQYELCPHYHLASINIFFKALDIADANGFRKDFPQNYIATIEHMIEAYYNIMLPDYSTPMFSDNRTHAKHVSIRDYNNWVKLFPKNEQISYFASERKMGKAPEYLSKGFLQAGFFMFRNGWDSTSTTMIVKAGPPAHWHNQPDNNTFDLYINGRNFFPDSGCYVYGGDDEVMKWRNWFRQTAIHKTITLDNKNIETTDSKTLYWNGDLPTPTLVTENLGYKELKHRRSVFFVDQKFFVIVDEAIGSAIGSIDLHFQLAEGAVNSNHKLGQISTTYSDGNNVVLQTIATQKTTLKSEKGWISYDYKKKVERPAYSFHTYKKTAKTIRYITVILPVEKAAKAPKIKADFDSNITDTTLNITVQIGQKSYSLGYALSAQE